MNRKNVLNLLRDTFKHSALAVAVAAVLAAAGTRVQAASQTYNLGPQDAGTTILTGLGNSITWIPEASLPAGSILQSVTTTIRLDSTVSDSWTSDLFIYLDPVPENAGSAARLQIGGDYSGAVGTVDALEGWDTGDNGVGTTIVETKTAGVDWVGAIDLHDMQVSIGNNYAEASWSGTITVVYDSPEPARILNFGPGAVVGEVVANAAAITWTVPFGTDVTMLAPTFTLSSGSCDKDNGGPTAYDFTSPVDYVVTDGLTVNTYTVTVTVAPNETTLIWDIGSGSWDTISSNWRGQMFNAITPYFSGTNVIFDKTAGGTINISPNISPVSTTVSASSGTYVFSGGPLAGAGSLTKSNGGNLTITTADNTYTGGTIINAGQLKMDVLANAALGTGDITLNGGRLYLERISAANNLIVNGGNLYPDNGFGDSLSGTVTLNSNLIIQGPNYATMTFSGSIGGVGGLTLNGQGQVVLGVANSYTGPTSVTACTLRCNNVDSLGSGDLSISSTLNSKVNLNYVGTKDIASLTLGGVPQPSGTHGSSISGADHPNDTYFTSTGTGLVRVPASSAKNMLTFSFGVLGAATIGDTEITLEVPFGTDVTALSPTYTTSLGASASPVSGTTLDFTTPQVYTVTAEDLSTKDYTVIVTEAVLPDIFTWANASSGNWSVPANWTNEADPVVVAAPLAGGRSTYTLNFTTPGTYTATNNLSAGFELNQLNLGAAVSLAGNGLSFVLNDAIPPEIHQNSGSGVSISNDLDLGADTTFGGTGNGQVNFTGLISGPGMLTKDGSGTLRIYNVNNSFTGGTVINSGTLFMDIDAKLGSGPITLNGGTLFMWRFYPTNELIVNGGTLLSENGFGNIWSGPITLNVTLNANVLYPLTCSNTISGVGGLNKTSGGTMTVSGTNDYSGPTTVAGGVLKCDNVNSLGSGDLSISSGGAKVNLNFSGTKSIASLTLGGVPQVVDGTYGSSTSGATFQDDNYFTGSGKVRLGPASDYDTWLEGFAFAPGDDTTPGGDPDGDGMSNFDEYAFGLNPVLGTSVNAITQQLDKTTGIFKYTRRATPATTGLFYSYEWSTSLSGTWDSFTPVTDPPDSDNVTPVEEITIEVPAVLLANPTLFVRVTAQQGS